MTKKIYEMNENEIDEFIQKHLPVKKAEKDKYGEVFTHPILINKMLDLFPPRVYENPELRWLDPSVGAGFFMIFVYIRLMHGLKKWQPNEKKRSQHIIQNMLHMVELNNANCKICKTIFGADLQIICGDFLGDTPYALASFDCIVGNPPFQDDYAHKTTLRVNGGKSKLYERIFLKSISLLKDGGYLSFVVPDNIFSGNGSQSYKTLMEYNVPFVSFNPENQDYFQKIQQPVCYFLLNKTTNKNQLTTLEHSNQLTFKIKLEDRPANPIRNWTPTTEKLIKRFVSNQRNNVSYVRGKDLASYKGNKYPIIYTKNKMLHTNKLELATGFGVKKAVLFSISPNLEFKMDYAGNNGCGPNTFFIPFSTNKEGKQIEQFLNSDDYKTLALATKTTRQYLKIAFIEHLKLTTIFKHNTTNKRRKTNKRRRTNNNKRKNVNNKTRKHK